MEKEATIAEESVSYASGDRHATQEKFDSHTVQQLTELIQGLTAVEGDTSVSIAFKSAPQGVLWSLFISLAFVNVNYNSQTIVSLFAVPAFVEKYGTITDDGTKTITAKWQTALSMYIVGTIIGSLTIGWFSDRYGRRLATLACTLMSIAMVFVLFFAPNVTVLTVGEILSGIPFGGYLMLGPLYVAEVSPMGLRGILLSFISMGGQFGSLIGQGVTSAVATRDDEWAYRIPFAVGWVFCILFLIGVIFMPETPWYLIHKGDEASARKSLIRLSSTNHRSLADVDEQLEKIKKTVLLERKLQAASTWTDLFRGTERRRTEIAVVSYASIAIIGIQFAYYSTYFFTLAGLSTTQAFNLGVGNMAVGVVGTAICFLCVNYIGRRTMFLTGLTLLTLLMLAIGILDLPASYATDPRLSWSQSILLVLWNFVCSLTISPISVIFTGEIPSTKAKNRTIALSTATTFISMLVVGIALPYMFNPDSGDMRGKVGFVFVATTFVFLVWTWFRVPEIAGRTYAEIDYLFEHDVHARRFKYVKVEELDRLGGRA